MTENDLYIWLEGVNERQDFDRDIMRNIMWSAMVDGKIKRNKKPSDIVPLEGDKRKTKYLVDQMSKADYLIKKEQIERSWKKKTNT